MNRKQISTKSWHYKFLNKVETNIPKNLCSYFWTLVFNLFTIIVGALFIFIILPLVLGTMLSSMIDTQINILIPNNMLFNLFVSYICSIVLISLILLFLFIYNKIPRINKKQTNCAGVTHETSLISNFFTDVKNKHCTLLEFKDDK